MTEPISKMIVLPQDGSEFAIKSIDYLNLMFKPNQSIRPVLLYVMPSLPAALTTAGKNSLHAAGDLKKICLHNETFGDEVLKTAKNVLVQYGFPETAIDTVSQCCKVDVARDIVKWAEDEMADTILLNSHGRSRVEAFFLGEVSLKLLECSQCCPVWLLRGHVTNKDVLIGVDNSENALKAVDHAGFMLKGTTSRVVLFHARKSLQRFLPKSISEDIPGLGKIWQEQAEQEIAPVMEKAKQMLITACIDEARIQTITVQGSRHTEKDILAAAAEHNCGTIVLGRQGESGLAGMSVGTNARKLVHEASDVAVWVV